LRGTGGLLRDLAVGYNDNDYLVVATATQLPLHPIGRFVADSAQPGVDVAVLEDLTGSPTSVFVIACRALHEVPAVGFVDLKEQALPAIAAKHSVRVTSLPGPLAVPVRTAANYLSAVRAHSRRLSGQHDTHSAFAERWRSDFAIVEPGARVHHSARLHNAVVLAGAEVEACSMVANSLVCPGGRVLRGNRVVNRLVTAEGCSSISDS
jgi:NDP-sugar pyrophosphorylase family protein